MRAISKADAAAAGLKFYFTGKPCKNGHVAERDVRWGKCRTCSAVGSAAWRVANPGVAAARTAEWRKNNRERALLNCREWHVKNRDRVIARLAAWRALPENRAAAAEAARQWRAANPERSRRACAMYRQLNPGKIRELARNRRARLAMAPGRHSESDIARLMLLQRGRCACCRRSLRAGKHVDHIVPIALGGSNWPWNLQVLCPTCNLRKNAKHPIEWAQQRGMLL